MGLVTAILTMVSLYNNGFLSGKNRNQYDRGKVISPRFCDILHALRIDMKRSIQIILILLISFAGFIFFVRPVRAQSQTPVGVVVFVREGCVHCADEETFLEALASERNDFETTFYRLENEQDRRVWEDFTTRVNESKVTPITVIGSNYIIGFDKAETTGKDIIALIEETKKSNVLTSLEDVQSYGSTNSTCDESGLVPCTVEESFSVSLPFIGKIDAQKYPLLIMSALLGFFDGFNPCAMWVLITFLLILLQVGSRRKMFLFAGTFIVAEAIMYSLILTVWFKTWDFVKLDSIITPVVGIVAILGGVFFLYEWRKKEIECRVTDLAGRHKTRQKLQELAIGKFTFVTFLAILGIAFSVNIIEFACSIGIPQAFTKILELNGLSMFQSVIFIAIYILFYMIDDFIVFGIALYGADKLSLTTKYSKISNLIGGIVMIFLGIMLIFKPGFLLF